MKKEKELKQILESLQEEVIKEYTSYGGSALDQYADHFYKDYKFGKPAEAAAMLKQVIAEVQGKLGHALDLAGSFQAPGLYIAFIKDLKAQLEKSHKINATKK